MPIKSKAQARLMYAALNNKTDKVPKEVAREYIAATPKESFSKLREKLKKKG